MYIYVHIYRERCNIYIYIYKDKITRIGSGLGANPRYATTLRGGLPSGLGLKRLLAVGVLDAAPSDDHALFLETADSRHIQGMGYNR